MIFTLSNWTTECEISSYRAGEHSTKAYQIVKSHPTEPVKTHPSMQALKIPVKSHPKYPNCEISLYWTGEVSPKVYRL